MAKDVLTDLLKDTFFFFEHILESEKMQEEYNIINCPNKQSIMKIIHDFKTNKNASLIKPLYEKDYSSETVPRVLLVSRDKYGFIQTQINNFPGEGTYIDPIQFISIIKQLYEDEDIKKDLSATKESEYSFEL